MVDNVAEEVTRNHSTELVASMTVQAKLAGHSMLPTACKDAEKSARKHLLALSKDSVKKHGVLRALRMKYHVTAIRVAYVTFMCHIPFSGL
ncbi:MAG TPA: hypothetical protein VF597_02665 [Candidatus Saccharimonadales bacterium]|jgi:hypothetical protein